MKPKAPTSPIEPIWNGKKLSRWLCRLDVAAAETDRDLANAAIRGLGKSAIPFLVAALRRGGRDAQRAASAFRVLGAEAVSAVEEIKRNPGPQPTFAAAALAAIGGPAFEALSSFLTHNEPMVRSAGAEGISEGVMSHRFTADQAHTCLIQLIRNTRDEHPHVRADSALAIGIISAEPARGVPTLEKLLDDRADIVLCAAVQALGHFGAAASAALPKLLVLAKALDGRLRALTVKTLSKIPHPESYKAVKRAQTDDYFLVRIAAVEGLGNFPDHATEVVPILVRVLETEPADLKTRALWALGRLGPLAKASLPVVRKLMGNPNAAGGEATIRKTIQQIERMS